MAAAGPDPPPDPFGVKALEKRFTDIMQNLQSRPTLKANRSDGRTR